MAIPLPRALYLLAGLSWALLCWPNPITVFMAACFSCLTIPIYKRLRRHAIIWRRAMLSKNRDGRWLRFLLKTSHWMPVLTYTAFIIAIFFAPIAALALLVSPQAVAGLTRLRELRANNFQLPPHWMEYFDSLKISLSEYPRLEKIFNDSMTNIDSLFSDLVSMLVSRSFGFVGGTMNLFWLLFLFLTLTVLFTVYGRLIRKTSYRILHISPAMLHRFLVAIYRALKAIVLGVALVALVQGALCGIGFAVAGVSQPAFWGLLATLVAPIPMIGTSLVWGPLCISLWFSGKTMAAVGLALWGAVFISMVDNFLRPFFLRQGIKTSFFVLILAILCGLNMFGGTGLVAGPVLLAIAMQAYEEANNIYKRPC